MKRHVQAAATFTDVTLSDMETYLKRAFWALRPTQGTNRGEVYYDLALSDKAAVRVYTSVMQGMAQAVGVGSDAIRVGLFSTSGKPLKPGKLPIVKRTQGWKDNLRERIEDTMEMYHDHEDDIEAGRFVRW